MQLHNAGACQVLFAFNHWGDGSGSIDLGIGNNTGNTNADWTFMANAPGYTVRQLQVFVQAAPALGIRLNSPGLVELFWADMGAEFVPETAADPTSGDWTVINATAVVTNGQWTVRVALDHTCQFFRLRGPDGF
jgi:hypothetical protein